MTYLSKHLEHQYSLFSDDKYVCIIILSLIYYLFCCVGLQYLEQIDTIITIF